MLVVLARGDLLGDSISSVTRERERECGSVLFGGHVGRVVGRQSLSEVVVTKRRGR